MQSPVFDHPWSPWGMERAGHAYAELAPQEFKGAVMHGQCLPGFVFDHAPWDLRLVSEGSVEANYGSIFIEFQP